MGAQTAGSLNTVQQSTAQVIDGSLWFNRLTGGGTSTGYGLLKRTVASDGNRQTWTISFWAKRDHFGGADNDEKHKLVVASTGSSNADYFGIDLDGVNGEKLTIQQYLQNTLRTNRVFRDTGWMHCLLTYDIRNTDPADKARLYINGVRETSFDVNNISSMSGDYGWNRASGAGGVTIGSMSQSDRQYYSGHLSQLYNIDGMSLGPGYFGYTDPLTNTWRPKRFEAKGTTVNDGRVWSSGMTAAGSGGWKGSHGAATGFDEVSDDVPDLTTWPRSSAPSNNLLINFTQGNHIQYKN